MQFGKTIRCSRMVFAWIVGKYDFRDGWRNVRREAVNCVRAIHSNAITTAAHSAYVQRTHTHTTHTPNTPNTPNTWSVFAHRYRYQTMVIPPLDDSAYHLSIFAFTFAFSKRVKLYSLMLNAWQDTFTPIVNLLNMGLMWMTNSRWIVTQYTIQTKRWRIENNSNWNINVAADACSVRALILIDSKFTKDVEATSKVDETIQNYGSVNITNGGILWMGMNIKWI